MTFPFPVLVGDIGGTNARFAYLSEPGAALSAPLHLRTADFAGLTEAVEAILPRLPARPRTLIACGAGPIVDGQLKLSNAPWLIDGREVARRLNLQAGLLLNDFEAQALSLPVLDESWTQRIGPALPPAPGPRLIFGPGTGLGVAALIEASGRHTPVASELCHATLGPADEEEAELWPRLQRAHGRITAESVTCGRGIARLHRARGKGPNLADEGAVVAAALADSASEAAHTVRLYWRIVARLVGDAALNFVARGGVTLAGGVLPRIAALLDAQDFRRAFEDKAPVEALARAIPTRLILKPDSVLAGMAAIAAAPDRYAIDYEGRAWA